MTTLSVHTYNTPQAAQRKIGRLEPQPGRPIISADDAAVISWPVGADRPDAWQASLMGGQALSGAFWGLLFSHLFLIPLSYAEPPGLAADLADDSLDPLGLTSTRLTTIRALVRPGTSAVLVLHPDNGLAGLGAVIGGERQACAAIVLDRQQSRRLLAGFAT